MTFPQSYVQRSRLLITFWKMQFSSRGIPVVIFASKTIQFTFMLLPCCLCADFFVNLLDSSLVEMHAMLVKRYGLLYEQNSQLFLDLFDDLQAYYKTGSVDLSDALDIFFETLFQRVFLLFNTQYVFNELYEDCVADNTKTVLPFGDVPRRLGPLVKRSFIAARTFSRALAFGRDVVMDLMRKVRQNLLLPSVFLA